MGVPSIVIVIGGVALWGLWSTVRVAPHALGARVAGRTAVAYGTVEESLYMSPLLFARATRVGFQPPSVRERAAVPPDRKDARRRLRFLHVSASPPDFERMRNVAAFDEAPRNRVDAYRPVWEDSVRFAAGRGSTNRVRVEVRGPLDERAYQPGPIAGDGFAAARKGEGQALVTVDGDGRVETVFLEQASGNVALDADLVRALKRGKASPGVTSVCGRVSVTVRSGDDGQN